MLHGSKSALPSVKIWLLNWTTAWMVLTSVKWFLLCCIIVRRRQRTGVKCLLNTESKQLLKFNKKHKTMDIIQNRIEKKLLYYVNLSGYKI